MFASTSSSKLIVVGLEAEVEVEVEANLEAEVEVEVEVEAEIEIEAPIIECEIEIELENPEIVIEVDEPEIVFEAIGEVDLEAPIVEVEVSVELGGQAELKPTSESSLWCYPNSKACWCCGSSIFFFIVFAFLTAFSIIFWIPLIQAKNSNKTPFKTWIMSSAVNIWYSLPVFLILPLIMMILFMVCWCMCCKYKKQVLIEAGLIAAPVKGNVVALEETNGSAGIELGGGANVEIEIEAPLVEIELEAG